MRIINGIATAVALAVEDTMVQLGHREQNGIHSYRVKTRRVRRDGEYRRQLPMEEVLRVILEDEIRELSFEQRNAARVAWKQALKQKRQQEIAAQKNARAVYEAEELELLALVDELERVQAATAIETKVIPFPTPMIPDSTKPAVDSPTEVSDLALMTSKSESCSDASSTAETTDPEEALQKRLKKVVESATPDPGHRRQLMEIFLENQDLAELALSDRTTLYFRIDPSLRCLAYQGAVRR